ncbi:MAG: sigma 54-interacting transcriptional regulator [Candidatus Cloacimonetes bacterium]|nr:sigma 54-interacting transcriptional regulator [Candidatus Cloacimonadota bacterium]
MLKRSSKYHATSLFNELSELQNSYVIYQTDNSDISNVTNKDFLEFLEKIEIEKTIKTDIKNRFNEAKPFLVKEYVKQFIVKDFQQKEEDSQNELVEFLALVELQVPFTLIVEMWENWQQLFQKAINSKLISIQGNSLIFTGKKTKTQKVPQKLMQRALQKTQKLNLNLISTQIEFLLTNQIKALKHFNLHTFELIEKEYYSSALEIFEWIQNRHRIKDLPINLQKRKAFLYRKCLFLQKSVELYESIEQKLSGIELATVLSDKATVLHEQQKYLEAIEIHKETAEIFHKNNKINEYLRTLNNIGASYFLIKKYKDAKETFKQLLKLSNENNKAQYITLSYLNLTEIFKQVGEWKKCLHFAKNTLELGRKYKKLSIQVVADLSIIYANFALGNIENLPEMILEVSNTKDIKQNIQRYIDILVKFLYISKFTDQLNSSEYADEIEKNYSQIEDDELQIEMFFYYYHRAEFLKCTQYYHKIQKKYPIIKAIFTADKKNMINYLRELAIEGDVDKYLYYATQIVYSGYFLKYEELSNEIKNYLQLNSYKPLEMLLFKKNHNPTMHSALPIFWEIINLIHGDVEFEKTMKAVLQGILKISGLERAVFFEFQNGNLQAKQGFYGNDNELDITDLKVSKTILKETIQLGQIRFLTNLQEDVQFDIHSSILGLGLRTAVCYPLIINHEIKGVIYSDAKGDKEFEKEEKSILEAIFVQACSALGKSLLFENLKRESEILQYSGVKNEFSEIIGKSPQIMEIFSLMKMVGEHNVNVLITGPTGSGKELIAKALHREYAKNAPFVAVNCAAIPENLLESELFGHTKGAFTGAFANKRGKIELANNGTLFLDEIGDMPMTLQAKLLRVLQERIVIPVGNSNEIPVSIRVITATNSDLEEKILVKEFREDLYYRLKVIKIDIPNLSERKSDIPLLIHHFIEKFNNKFNKNIQGVSLKALHNLKNNEWKGNVRELENEIEKAVLLCKTDQIDVDIIKEIVEDSSFSIMDELPGNWKEYQKYKNRIISTLDRNFAKQLVKSHKGNILQASKQANISRTQLYRILHTVDTK